MTLGIIRTSPVDSQIEKMELAKSLAHEICAGLDGKPSRFLVGICGWADTGKSTLAKDISAALDTMGVRTNWISTDAFMKDRAERNALGITGYNHQSIDITLLASAIDQFVDGVAFHYRPYDNKSGTKLKEPRIMAPGRVLVVEGIHAFHPAVEKSFLLKIFIDSDELTLREMRLRANVRKRGMNLQDATSRIQIEWDDFCSTVRPQKNLANFVVHVDREYNYSHLAVHVKPTSMCHQSIE